ncbi:GntR family transcriptional regulator [Blastopirellula marina]|uniref:GntR family transcriptional regulator n=1 Tax=Blastopirellula marina TaxID=124 RepID=A0A2S8GKY7_9BACT|nr:GntR family transcriptional regulator [Blastopirellula marina]PQO26648.1 GntR family transcriptional regulator [Blastopirellula marina]PQO45103.1 GntR family transcriptional regulator [Blastopirellula marina]PTL40959.1 GntR family transcriptional regulator [Blastopirellula marina]
MYIRIERGAATPISRQIAEQVRAQCLAGRLSPGERLPSVRQLAAELVVNVNTVVRVYEKLAAEGLVEMRHGEGTFVLPQSTGRGPSAELAEQREQYSREFRAIVRRGLLLGFNATELRKELTAAAAEAKTSISEAQNEETRS